MTLLDVGGPPFIPLLHCTNSNSSTTSAVMLLLRLLTMMLMVCVAIATWVTISWSHCRSSLSPTSPTSTRCQSTFHSLWP